MMNTVTAPRMMPARVAPPPSVSRPLYNTPVAPSLSKPTAVALVPAAPSAPSIMVLPQAAICGIIARMIAGAWLLGVSWKACEPISMPI